VKELRDAFIVLRPLRSTKLHFGPLSRIIAHNWDSTNTKIGKVWEKLGVAPRMGQSELAKLDIWAPDPRKPQDVVFIDLVQGWFWAFPRRLEGYMGEQKAKLESFLAFDGLPTAGNKLKKI
jgi:hypothetical protein